MWLLSPRQLILGFVFMFSFVYFIKPMNELSNILDTPVNVLEPFAAIVNDRYAMPLLIVGYLILISDFPMLNDSTTFTLFRTGRKSWLISQMIFLVMSGLSYILFVLFSTMLCVAKNAYLLNAWSLIQKNLSIDSGFSLTLQETYPFARIDSSVTAQARPYTAVLHGILLILLFEITVGCLQIIFALYQKKVISVFINMVLCAAGLIMLKIDLKAKWLLPVSNAVFGWHYDDLYNQTNFPIEFSYIYFAVWIVLLIICLARVVKNCSFHITGGTE